MLPENLTIWQSSAKKFYGGNEMKGKFIMAMLTMLTLVLTLGISTTVLATNGETESLPSSYERSPLDGEWVIINRDMAIPATPDNPRQPRTVTVTGSGVHREERTPNGDNAQFQVRAVGHVTATSTTGRFFARAELRSPAGVTRLADAERWVNSGQTAHSSTGWLMGGGMAIVADSLARIFFGN